MPYINLAFHEKLLNYFESMKDLKSLKKVSDKDAEIHLRNNIDRLDELAKTYKQTICNLQNISDEYNGICKKVRLSLRKLRMLNVRNISKGH